MLQWNENIAGTFNELHSFEKRLNKKLVHAGLRPGIICSLELAIEEMVSNIIKHGYKNKTGIIHFEVNIEIDEINILIVDSAGKFNPIEYSKRFAAAKPPFHSGNGIKLAKGFIDSMSYKRFNDLNILKLTLFQEKFQI